MDPFLLLQTTIVSSILAAAAAALVSRLRGRRLRLPPGPTPIPIFGSWLQVGNNLDHRGGAIQWLGPSFKKILAPPLLDHHVLADHASKYGNLHVLRMGSLNVVTVSSKELAKEVLLTKGAEFGSRSRNIVFDVFTGKGQDMIFTEYGDHWRKMRRIATVPFFTNKVVQRYRGDWEAEAAAVVEDVRRDPSAGTEGVVLRTRLQRMVYNNVYKILFDKTFSGEEDPLYVKVKGTNGERSKLGQSLVYNFGDFIPMLRPFLRGYLKVCEEVTRRRLDLYKESFLDTRKKHAASTDGVANRTSKCVVDHFLEARDNGEINEANILYFVENMNIAAVETTVWALEWAVAELINNPNVQGKLRAEIDKVLGPGVQVTEPDTHKLPYLQALIKETLRLRNIVPCLLPHMNLKDAKLGGYDIPAQSRVLVNAWQLSNDPALWERPEEFRPERFLEEESKVDTNGNDLKYIPFGVGRRSCPGMVIAMPVLGITLGRLVQNFELLPPPGQSRVDTAESNGQFSMRILKHSTVVLKPRTI